MQEIDLPEERRQRILDELHRTGKLVAADLSQRFGVSEDTIRRDLRELADARLLKRVHGGALPVSPATGTYRQREKRSPLIKAELAEAAAQLVSDGQVILFGGGTTNAEVANHLPAQLRATAVTASPQIALTLARYPQVEVILIGGRLDKKELSTADAEAVRQLRHIQADLGFLGVCSLHPEAGISATAYNDIGVMQSLIEQSGEVVAIATADKLGTVSPFIAAPIDSLTYLVTENQVAEETLRPYAARGIRIIKPNPN